MTDKKNKLIRIRVDQDEWLEKRHINLSSLVQEKLDEEIEKWGDLEEGDIDDSQVIKA